MITTKVNLNGLYAYVGTAKGMTKAWSSIEYQEDYIDDLIDETKSAFTVETIAANVEHRANISHVFEWPNMKSNGVAGEQPSKTPLFDLFATGSGKSKTLRFDFLPSQKLVPLPDPNKYGFKRSKLKFLSRHKFKQKALVMETMNSVTINPTKGHGRLFIPTEESKYGYEMPTGPRTINPGGNSTGQFGAWWNKWFETRANVISLDMAEKEVVFNKRTGQRLIQEKAGKRFANQGKTAFAIVKSAESETYAEVIAAGRKRKR